jgi:hypothetical protein
MKIKGSVLALAVLVLVAMATATMLALTGHAVPDWCGPVIIGGFGALGGITIPGEPAVIAAVAPELATLAQDVAAELGKLLAPQPSVPAAGDASPLPPIAPAP